MNAPDDLRYTKSHEWVRKEADGTLTLGITDYAQQALGDLVFLELPAVGRKLEADEACAVIESVKAASEAYAPVSGVVVAVNAALTETPEAVNTDAYGSWLFKLKPANPADADALLDAADYATVAGA